MLKIYNDIKTFESSRENFGYNFTKKKIQRYFKK